MSKLANLILFGTQTGTAEDLADELHEVLESDGVKCELQSMFDVRVDAMVGRERVFVVISTWGDGDPPDDAEDFCEALGVMEVGMLAGVEFAVFGIGDRGYEEFCECGKFVDRELERVGAKRILERVDCDVDIDGPFGKWMDEVALVMGGRVSAG